MKKNVISHIYIYHMAFMLFVLHSGAMHSAAGKQPAHSVQRYLETPTLHDHAQAALALAHMYYEEQHDTEQSFEHLNKIISDRAITSPRDRAYAKLLMSKVYYYERTDIPYRHGKVLKLLSEVISDQETPDEIRIKAMTLWNTFVTDDQIPHEVRIHAREIRYYIHAPDPYSGCSQATSATRLSKRARELSFPCAATSMPNDEIDEQKQRDLKRHCC